VTADNALQRVGISRHRIGKAMNLHSRVGLAPDARAQCRVYQLVEQKGVEGLARYRLLVNPALRALDERSVKEFFLAELARRRPPCPFLVEQWARAVDLVVVRENPVLTARGKFQPFRTLRPS
jgi:hypothetical protein